MKRGIFTCLFIIIICVCSCFAYRFYHPLVSVVMLTYNREQMVPKAIESVLAQTYKNFELIIINDASTDNTPQILSEYARNDSRIRIINNAQNRGILHNRNIGILLAKGKYLAWQDDDDISEPTRIEEQVNYLRQHPEIAILGTETSLLGTHKKIKIWPTENDPLSAEIVFLIGRLPVVLPTGMWRMSFIKENNIFFSPEIPLSEDFYIYDKVIDSGGKIMTLDKALYQYRVHHSNKREYYLQIENIQKSFYKQRWNKFFPDVPYPDSQCNRLLYIRDSGKFFPPDFVQKMYQQHCQTDIYFPSSYEWFIVYKDNSEEPIIVSKNDKTFFSQKRNKSGKIIKTSPKYTHIMWDGEHKVKKYKNPYYEE